MFILQRTNEKPKRNPINDIMEALSPVIGSTVDAFHTKRLLHDIDKSDDQSHAINNLIASKHVPESTKQFFLNKFLQESSQAQENAKMQQIMHLLGHNDHPQSQENDYNNQSQDISDADLYQLSMLAPSIANIAQKQTETRRKEAKDEERYIENQFEPVKKEILESYKSIPESEFRIDEQMRLNKSGKMSAPVLSWIAERFNAPFIASAGSQYFDKLSNEELRQAKALFGSRVTEGEVKLFLKTVAKTSNTKEGREMILRRAKDMLGFKRLKFEAMKEEQEKGITKDLEQRIEQNYAEKAHQYMQSLQEKYRAQDAPQVRVRDKKTGKIYKIPDFALQEALEDVEPI